MKKIFVFFIALLSVGICTAQYAFIENRKNAAIQITNKYYGAINYHINTKGYNTRDANRKEMNVLFADGNVVYNDLNLIAGKKISNYTNIDEYLSQVEYYSNTKDRKTFSINHIIDTISDSGYGCIYVIVNKTIIYGDDKFYVKDSIFIFPIGDFEDWQIGQVRSHQEPPPVPILKNNPEQAETIQPALKPRQVKLLGEDSSSETLGLSFSPLPNTDAKFPLIGVFWEMEDLLWFYAPYLQLGFGLETNGFPGKKPGQTYLVETNSNRNKITNLFFAISYTHFAWFGVDLFVGPSLNYSSNITEIQNGITTLYKSECAFDVLFAPSVRICFPFDYKSKWNVFYKRINLHIGYNFYILNNCPLKGIRFGLSYSG